MADLLKMSTDIIDDKIGVDDAGPMNRINFQLSEIADGVAMVEAFSHCVLFESEDGLIAFDTSGPQGGGRVMEAIRGWLSTVCVRLARRRLRRRPADRNGDQVLLPIVHLGHSQGGSTLRARDADAASRRVGTV